MADTIEAAMLPNVSGFAYSIYKNGMVRKEGGAGFARSAPDGFRMHGPMQRNNLASTSKAFTAIAVLQLIEANKSKGVAVDTKIGAYLPKFYKAGPNIAGLKFSELLRHRSGLAVGDMNSQSLLNFSGVAKVVEAGVGPRPVGGGERARDYDNVNYALLRELLPALWAESGQAPPAIPSGEVNGIINPIDVGSVLLRALVTDRILKPVGISEPLQCKASASKTGTRYYPLAAGPNTVGVLGTDQSSFCGSGGMHLSTNDMAKVLSALFHSEKLLPAPARKTMIDRELSFDPFTTSRGVALMRAGSVGVGGGAGTKACMMHFPDGTDAALVQNSPDKPDRSPCTVLINAFEAAWK
ncbi:serine hydrolase domain-containing protein [Allosphingosinicella deserti]|uniref:Beta-lactamase-related domain-containing protein n=1 Tax=Allosphingosinicella deserti TaxID=2116704 RepID=A0A2P7QZC4_9SPHN|nr:serine hydrolase domain-containing protein [Sphingomonas deserti]PSJ43309.1 hypothetical protein C7I55_02740 [Sphingomonas deserti]